ncbi:hypothetical protein P175DRAFT_0500365 [Aspergillus ochraceoroseus IBT 24754]|uniref:Uncharacterized protein n=1 Tax=Aspergillus ochraceoroseus IBT 24754 TaxID=1392256 RepID=A0A2T5LYW5_9EURO|nr:uncharacterized protein P175DRAFT_0500365 [Aspergillus ochraceoroseus IBT 24754]PTU21477.1 hypothetical protein P175DRAFT_0500365 [Aspergillus ochraceoroseus IBT 24754]
MSTKNTVAVILPETMQKEWPFQAGYISYIYFFFSLLSSLPSFHLYLRLSLPNYSPLRQ